MATSDLLGIMPADQGMNLGRATPSGQRPWMSNQRAYAQSTGSALDAVLDLGQSLVGQSLDEARRKRFYEGQNRIMTAALEGKQQEELSAILKDQPWYAGVLGNGAMAKGAIEQAGRSGAGKMFDDWIARLPEDTQTNPEVYKTRVSDFIKGQLTGDPDVDNAFIPSMTKIGELLVQTQLKKHLEFNTQQTIYGATNETYTALKGLEGAAAARGPGATFNEDTDPAQWSAEEQAAYLRTVMTFDPSQAPKNLEYEKWQDLKLQTALPLIEAGSTGIAKAMDESGFLKRLTPKERDQFDTARRKGKVFNDANKQSEFIGAELVLMSQIHDATSMNDLPAILNNARIIRARMLSEGGYIPESLPADFKDEAAITKYVTDGMKRVLAFEDRQEARAYAEAQAVKRKNERLYEIRYAASMKNQETASLSIQIMDNVRRGNPLAPVPVKDADGNIRAYLPSQKNLQDTYDAVKVAYLQSSPEDKQRILASVGAASLEDFAKKSNLVDAELKAQTTGLGFETGSSAPSDGAISLLAKLDRAYAAGGDGYVAQHFNDSATLNKWRDYRALLVSGNQAEAWARSFGRKGEVLVDKATPDQIRDKSLKAAKSLGVAEAQQEEAAGMINRIASAYHKSGTPYEKAVERASQDVRNSSDVVAGKVVLGVPAGQRLHEQIGVSNPSDADAALRLWTQQVLPEVKNFSVLYSTGKLPGTNDTIRHAIVFPNPDGSFSSGNIIPIDYDGVRGAIQTPKTMIEAMREAPRATSFSDGLFGPQLPTFR